MQRTVSLLLKQAVEVIEMGRISINKAMMTCEIIYGFMLSVDLQVNVPQTLFQLLIAALKSSMYFT